MTTIPDSWKQTLSRMMRWPMMGRLMRLGIQFVVPKQRIGVGVVVMDNQGRILLLRHVFHPFAPWGTPGGWLNRNEDPAAGALRELREETGLTVELKSVVLIKREHHPPHVGIVFLAYATPQPMQLSGEIMEARWFYPHDLPHEMFDFTRTAIDTAVHMHQGHDGPSI